MTVQTDNNGQAKKPGILEKCCGCGIALLIFAILLFAVIQDLRHERSEEHLPKYTYSKKGINWSYYDSFMWKIGEFDIAEDDFRKDICSHVDALDIETLPALPPFDFEKWRNSVRGDHRVNTQRGIPLKIIRYIRMINPNHKECYSENCKIDPTGKTEDSCFHSVSKGWYREDKARNGGGLYYVWDKENGRCYYANPHN